MRCIACDFDLERTMESRCPECGRAFDRDDAGTWIGPGHTRFSRRIARAPGWPMIVAASLVALLILASGFGPSWGFGLQISALLAGVLLGFLYLGRVIAGFIGHGTLPRSTPRAVPLSPVRWLLAPMIVALAILLSWSRATRGVAFVLDRSVLESIAQDAPVQPSAWSPMRAWSGSVTRGAVWDDAEVWAFDPESAIAKWKDPFDESPVSDQAWEARVKRMRGEVAVVGTVDVRLARLAVFPIEGTGYDRQLSAAWAYAPDAPDLFGLKGRVFERYRGDWYVSRGWIEPLEDQP